MPLPKDSQLLHTVLGGLAEDTIASTAELPQRSHTLKNAITAAAQACFLPPVVSRMHGASTTCPNPVPVTPTKTASAPSLASLPATPRPMGASGVVSVAPSGSLSASTPPAARRELRARPPRTPPSTPARRARHAASAPTTPELPQVCPSAPALTPLRLPDHNDMISPLSAQQSLGLLIYDAVAGIRWCLEQEASYAPARSRLAAFFSAAGAGDAARMEIRKLLTKTDGKRLSPESVDLCPGAGTRRIEAGEVFPAEWSTTATVKRGMRPVQPLGKHLCAEPMDPKFAAALRRDLCQYVALCRQGGAVTELVGVVEWGLSTKWGSSSNGFVVNLSEIAELALGAALLDTLAELLPQHPEFADADAVVPRLLHHVRRLLLRADASASCSLATLTPPLKGASSAATSPSFTTESWPCGPPSSISRLRTLLLAAWRLYLALWRQTASSESPWVSEVPAALAAAQQMAQKSPKAVGGRLCAAAATAASQDIFCELSKVSYLLWFAACDRVMLPVSIL
jgi:hypothetical protein